MLADQEMIAKLIPHTGSMCLLDGVLERDTQRIRCVSSSHRDTDNPLRSGDELSALCGIEYAAQVMAVHGAWDTQLDSKPRAGYQRALHAEARSASSTTVARPLMIFVVPAWMLNW